MHMYITHINKCLGKNLKNISINGIDTKNDQEIIQNHFAKLYNLLLTWMPKNSWMPASLTCSIGKYDVIW